MDSIKVKGLVKHFRVLNRREGLLGSVRDLFSGDYRIVRAVDDISFSIASGEIVGFLGPNGAGKSTTIKMLTGALVPTSGVVSVDKFVPYKDRKKYVGNIGIVIGQRSQLWWDIPVIESFKVLKEIYKVDRAEFERNMKIFFELGNFGKLLHTPVRNLSLGQRTLCDILAAFLHNPKVVYLDEPTIGLDVAVKSEVWCLIKKLNEINRTTVILTSHDIDDVENMCQRIILIDKGKIIYDGATRDFHKLFGAYRTLKVVFSNRDSSGLALLSNLNRKFKFSQPISGDGSGENWIRFALNEEECQIVDVMRAILEEYDVIDIEVERATLSQLVRRAYEGDMM